MQEADIPAVAALFARVYPNERGSRSAREEYIHEVFFRNPWIDPELPSWIAFSRENAVGFQGVIPRPMSFRGRGLRAAASAQFMVDPEARSSLTALQLLKACLSGPQDLTLADGANEGARLLGLAVGVQAPALYGLHWVRPLRPLATVIALRGEQAPAKQSFVSSCAALADAWASRLRPNRFLREASALSDCPIDPVTMWTHFPEFTAGAALRPVYSVQSLAWLLAQAARKHRHGELRMRGVTDDRGGLLGWYLYYLQRGGIGEVLQIVSRPGARDAVLTRLLRDAWQEGAAALRGSLDPGYLPEMSRRHCWLRAGVPCTLVHARDRTLTAAFQEGQTFVSRLDGEWWMHFLGEAAPAAADPTPLSPAPDTILHAYGA